MKMVDFQVSEAGRWVRKERSDEGSVVFSLFMLELDYQLLAFHF